MSHRLVHAYKRGEASNCSAKKTQLEIEHYCEHLDDHNFDHMELCKNCKYFCFVCCDNEFGDFNPTDLARCQTACQAEFDQTYQNQGIQIKSPLVHA